MSDTDSASILYPNDKPAASAPPEWFSADIAAAESRLMGKVDGNDTQERDGAETLYDESEQANQFRDEDVASFFNQQALNAVKDDDPERAEALGQASKALAADMRAAGTSSKEFGEALTIINEVAYEAKSDADRERAHAATLAGLERDLGPTFQSDLDAARLFIQDLEKVAPGTIASLEQTGAGNDHRLIRKAIKEAKRRGVLMNAIPCPCCGNAVADPTLDIVVQHYGISELEARILGPLWKAKGRPVATERIFDSIYVGAVNDTPSRMKMYEALKFGLHRLRRRLQNSGLSIDNAGYRRGFLLSVKGRDQPCI